MACWSTEDGTRMPKEGDCIRKRGKEMRIVGTLYRAVNIETRET